VVVQSSDCILSDSVQCHISVVFGRFTVMTSHQGSRSGDVWLCIFIYPTLLMLRKEFEYTIPKFCCYKTVYFLESTTTVIITVIL
jgi:hypothetical protein